MHLVNILRIITFGFLVGHSILTISDFNSFRFLGDTLYICSKTIASEKWALKNKGLSRSFHFNRIVTYRSIFFCVKVISSTLVVRKQRNTLTFRYEPTIRLKWKTGFRRFARNSLTVYRVSQKKGNHLIFRDILFVFKHKRF